MDSQHTAIVSDDEFSEETHRFDDRPVSSFRRARIRSDSVGRSKLTNYLSDERRRDMKRLYIRHFGSSLATLLRSENEELFNGAIAIMKDCANARKSGNSREASHMNVRLKEYLGEELWKRAHTCTKISLRRREKVLLRKLNRL